MIVLNLDKIRKEAAKKETHKPEITIIPRKVAKDIEVEIEAAVMDKLLESHESEKRNISLKDALINDLNNQERDLRIERAKLSNQYRPMIANDATPDELSAHYQKIEAISDEIREVYNSREHVLKYGRLPDQHTAEVAINSTNILALKDHRRSLINRRCKIAAKIEKGKATGSKKLTEWQSYHDMLEAEYVMVQSKIKELSYE